MKNYLFTILLASLFWGCSKSDSVDRDIPQWLEAKINEIRNTQEAPLYVVSEYKINNYTYYNISKPFESCALCSLYDTNGDVAIIDLPENAEIKLVRTIWPVNEKVD